MVSTRNKDTVKKNVNNIKDNNIKDYDAKYFLLLYNYY